MARIFAMERLIKRLADLNRRMLDSSRLAAGQFELRLEDVDLTALVQEVLANNAEQLAWSKCAASLSSPGPVVGRWDRLRLEQVVSNLIGNAMKYGHGEPISVSVEATANLARLSVRDHGIGIGAKDHERIFDRFERAAPVGASTSLGLGLWVSGRSSARCTARSRWKAGWAAAPLSRSSCRARPATSRQVRSKAA